MSNKQFWQLASIHLKEIIREPGVLFWGMIFPLLMAWGLGIAFTQPSQQKGNIALIGQFDKDSLMTSLTQKAVFKNDSVFSVAPFYFRKTNFKNAELLLKRGEVSLIVSKAEKLQFTYDPANKDANLLKYLFLEKYQQKKSYISQKIKLKGSRYIDFLLPGLIGMNIMTSTLWGISYGLISKRKQKLLRRMYATPMNKSYFLSSLILVRSLVNILEMFILYAFAHFMFDFNLYGNWLSVFGVFVAGNIAFSGFAILLASRTSNTEIGNGLINFVTLPMFVLSGIFFSYHNFPEAWIPFIHYLPLTLLIDILRAVFNEGLSLNHFISDSLILSAFGIVAFFVGLKVFKWF